MRITVELQPIGGRWLAGIDDCRVVRQAAKEKSCPAGTSVMPAAGFGPGGQER